jgi:hypothetical protein
VRGNRRAGNRNLETVDEIMVDKLMSEKGKVKVTSDE